MEKNFKGNFERSIETQLVIDVLLKTEVNDVITYEELSDIINCDIRSNRNCLISARRIVLNENGIVFETVRKIGIKRVDDRTIVDYGSDYGPVRRFAKRKAKLLSVVNFENLDTDYKIKHNLGMCCAGILSYMTKMKTIKHLSSKIKETDRLLAVNKTLEYFKLQNKIDF